MKHIILDTDPGVDDALAFLLAFNSPELKVEAVTTVAGNLNHTKSHFNAKKLLEFLGKTDTPVCKGAEKPLIRAMNQARNIHGTSGLGEAVLPPPSIKTSSLNAVEMITKKTEELGKKLTLVGIGPLTNIASAVLADPELPLKVGALVIMGGAFNLTPYGLGNVNDVSEFNIWFDPEAAHIVFNSGIPLTCAGLDTTTCPDYRLSSLMFEEIRKKNSKQARLVVDLCKNLVERFNGVNLHDPMAVAYVIDPSMFKTQKHKVNIETRGELTRGMTIVERKHSERVNGEPNTELIVEVEAERFHNLLMDRVT
jgi:inosine-uridine nucleoside N-ribohydrolase